MLVEWFSRTTAFLLITVLTPLFLTVSFFSLVFQGLPIFFFQERVGMNYSPFRIVKFRTMNNSSSGPLITTGVDKRITFWGRGLRLFKLDELPQLWNVLKGEMRFVGPRPEVPEYVNEYDYSFLTNIKPGLTDFSSIILRNESQILHKLGGSIKYKRILPVKIQLAHLYALHKSFTVDLVLVFCTMLAIIFPKMASKIVQKLFVQRVSPELISEIQQIL
jgi:lipopolysaccharide/colanic/teichoic acid biosynthesis glycosyltransferase